MSDRLGALRPIIERKHREVEALRCGQAALWARARAQPPAPAIETVLRGGAVVAEMKRRSPSGGELRADLDCGGLAAAYATAGAAAISVLTDGPDFGGSLHDLVVARRSAAIPLLRKDFVVDPLQIAQARVAGADWVLLILAVLDDEMMHMCLEACLRCGAGALVEAHSEEEIERALHLGAPCIGVNNRDLRTLRTSLGGFASLRRRVPSHVPVVAESGVRTADDVRTMRAAGADAVLVGEALMRARDPASACADLVRAATDGSLP